MTQPDNKTPDDATVEGETTEYLEYKGDPAYGTEFLTEHRITPAQAKAAEWSTIPEKDMVWTRRESGRYKGRMLLKLADLTPGVEEELVTDPAYKVVKLK